MEPKPMKPRLCCSAFSSEAMAVLRKGLESKLSEIVAIEEKVPTELFTTNMLAATELEKRYILTSDIFLVSLDGNQVEPPMQLMLAYGTQKLVVAIGDGVTKIGWVMAHCMVAFNTLPEAVDYLKAYLVD